ncbi:MAG: flagellar biosynthesis/type III secretory pathway chaperone [Paracoccaceae bacterium]|jgi:flagellar biosynthesis/type III secretory pathway chaperone
MTIDNIQSLIDELDDLLDSEKKALVQGDMERVGRLMSQKEFLIESLNAMDDLDRENLTHLHQKVMRNQTLLDSALEGIRAVATRMSELRRVRSGLETYDEQGRKQHFSTQRTVQVEKRA